MGRYNFKSVGAEAGKGIEEFLVQRELMNRQRMMDQLEQERRDQETQRRADELKLQQKQEERIAADSKANRDALEEERRFRRASTISSTAMPGDKVDDPTADLLRGAGYGSQISQTPPQQGADLGVDEQGVNQYQVIPGVMEMRGGSQYLSARAAAQERAEQAKAADAARAERAEADRVAAAERAADANQTRLTIAGVANQGREETTRLRNDLLAQQVEVGKQKEEDKKVADKRSKDAARVTSGATIDVLKQLADFDETSGTAKLKPDAAGLFGMGSGRALQYVPGSGSATASASLDRLQGRVIVDLLNEMKNQSRTGATGFGALSGPELKLLENAASQLTNRNISPERAAEELQRIYQLATQLYGGAESDGAPAGGGGVVKWGRDAQGRPVRVP